MIIEMLQAAYGLTIGQQIAVGEALGLHLMTYGSAKLIDATDSETLMGKADQGAWGFVIITGNTAVVAPDGLRFASFGCQTDGVILEALKKDAAKTVVARGFVGEGAFPAAEKALKQDKWYPFLQKITSIKLKGATDEVIAWYKPL